MGSHIIEQLNRELNFAQIPVNPIITFNVRDVSVIDCVG